MSTELKVWLGGAPSIVMFQKVLSEFQKVLFETQKVLSESQKVLSESQKYFLSFKK